MKISRWSPRDSKIVLAKFRQNRLRIDWEIGEKHGIQVNLTAGIGSLAYTLSSRYIALYLCYSLCHYMTPYFSS